MEESLGREAISGISVAESASWMRVEPLPVIGSGGGAGGVSTATGLTNSASISLFSNDHHRLSEQQQVQPATQQLHHLQDHHHHQHHQQQQQQHHNYHPQQLQQHQETTSSSWWSIFSSDLVLQYVNLNLVRKMIAQNLIEFIFICVIITYLIYYFSQVSRRPRLIGNNRSKFVKFIKHHLSESSLLGRFSPLIYFWGTNPQTALFGYLQGQTSVDEMPRNKFKRQYLYVSDAQYLMSNVDLSQHYRKRNDAKRSQKQPQQQQRLMPLCANQLLAHQQPLSQLDQNIRLALGNMLPKPVVSNVGKSGSDTNTSTDITTATTTTTTTTASINLKEMDLSSSGSSSDSGVFASRGSGSSTCSSTSSLDAASSSSSTANSTYVNIVEDEEDIPDRCNCKRRYSDSARQPLEEIVRQTSNNPVENITKPEEQNKHWAPEQLEFGQCALDWHKDSHKNYHRNKLVALISAGMTTGSDKKYVTDTVSTLESLGYEVCVFIRRGVGGLKLSSSKFFSPAKWRDFEAAVLSVRQQRPDAKMVAVGFSFGSIELCRYLCMSGSSSQVNAALLVSCPFDPEAGGRNMRKRALNRRIDAYLAKNLAKQLHQAAFGTSAGCELSPTSANTHVVITNDNHQQYQHKLQLSNHNGSVVNLAGLPKIKSLVEFEDHYNRVLQNYPNREAYAADSRLQNHLCLIETPTLCLSSEDDFMAPLKLLPLDQINANPNLCMVLTRRGGHMAFIDGLIWPKRPYFAQRIITSYMAAVRDRLQESQPTTSLFGGAQELTAQVHQTRTCPQVNGLKVHHTSVQLI